MVQSLRSPNQLMGVVDALGVLVRVSGVLQKSSWSFVPTWWNSGRAHGVSASGSGHQHPSYCDLQLSCMH